MVEWRRGKGSGSQAKWRFSVSHCSAVCFFPTIVSSLLPVFLTQKVSCLTCSSTPPSWNNCSVWHVRFCGLNHIRRTGRFGCNDILDPKMTSDRTCVLESEWGFWGFVLNTVSPRLFCRNILNIYWGSGQAVSQVSQLIVEPSFHIPIKSQLEKTVLPSSL